MQNKHIVLAACAMDITPYTYTLTGEPVYRKLVGVGDWAPAIDDLDSHHLAVSLGLDIRWDEHDVGVSHRDGSVFHETFADNGGNRFTALRVATLLSAAEVGLMNKHGYRATFV